MMILLSLIASDTTKIHILKGLLRKKVKL